MADQPDDPEVSEHDKRLSLRFWSRWGTPLLRRLLGAKAER